MIRTEYTEGFKFKFVEYAPADAEGALPLIIQLHGAGERGSRDDELYLVDKFGFSELIREGDYKCRFIMPQCPKNTFWVARIESLIEFIEQIKAHFAVDESKIYLTGLSMGGFGTWYTAMARPDIFAAIAPVCGGGMAWNAGMLKMPVWAFHGVEDTTVSVSRSDEMVEALKNRGADVTYSRMEGVNHWAWTPAYTDELYKKLHS